MDCFCNTRFQHIPGLLGQRCCERSNRSLKQSRVFVKLLELHTAFKNLRPPTLLQHETDGRQQATFPMVPLATESGSKAFTRH
eukprot:s402_g22.t1